MVHEHAEQIDDSADAADIEHVDVLIVGAGISGIGAAYYVGAMLPETTYAIVEARDALGGTWDLFRYPGIRSDSDLHTFGFEFKPWTSSSSLADGDAILDYLNETVREFGIDRHIRFGNRVVGASWSSESAEWTVNLVRTHTGEHFSMRCTWLWSAAGYYRYDAGYTPEFPGRERFQGTIVHPQAWPTDLDYAGKQVVVIGSGATAVTIVPAMARTAGHVTMLQRTPTYIIPLPGRDIVGVKLRSLLGDERGHALARRRSIAQQRAIWWFTQRHPQAARTVIRYLNVKSLPEGYPVDTHFNPPYNPWEQRLCVVPDGDLFKAISAGTASVVTDTISTFTETGVLLKSGKELPADIIVTATGLVVEPMRSLDLTVNGQPVDITQTVAFKGAMLSGIPNFAFSIGYTNASWTLKVGLVFEHMCRLIEFMRTRGYDVCTPVVSDPAMPTRPLLDFAAGYIQRAINSMPKGGTAAPWVMSMDYKADVGLLRDAPVDDPNLHFGRRQPLSGGLSATAGQPLGSH